ncbi:MAG: hypothetical protein ACK4NF_03260, partial [Planctomycetota bacterium]
YIYSLIKAGNLGLAYFLLDTFKKKNPSSINSYLLAIDKILEMYVNKNTLTPNVNITNTEDFIDAINNYLNSINWHNALNIYILKEYYNFLKDNRKISQLLQKYIDVFK